MVAIDSYSPRTYLTRRQFYDQITGQMALDRGPWEDSWRDLGRNFCPWRMRFLSADVNRPQLLNSNILNTTPLLVARTQADGMHAGMTNQASPWFGVAIENYQLMKNWRVKRWLKSVQDAFTAILGQGNFYDLVPNVYYDGGIWSIGALGVEEDLKDIANFQSFPVGSYWVGKDHRGRPCAWWRKYRMTVRQILEEFGIWNGNSLSSENLSQYVMDCYRNGELERWVEVCHFIYPNDRYNPFAIDSKYKKFASVRYESGANQRGYNTLTGVDGDKYLSEKGYDWFPILFFEWGVNGEDTYGSGAPGTGALPDAKSLQKIESKKLQGVERKVAPPLNAPASMRNQRISLLPAAVNFVQGMDSGSKGVTPVYQVDFDTGEAREEILAYEDRLKKWFNYELWRSVIDSERQKTATEIYELRVEKLSGLAPLQERGAVGLFNPLFDILFPMAMKRGLIPPPPPELWRGGRLEIEYLSVLAKALKASGTATTRNFLGDVAALSQTWPMAKFKVKEEIAVDELADSYGASPEMVRDNEEFEQLVAAQAQQQQAAAQAEQMAALNQGASAMKNLSQAQLETPSALSEMATAGA